MLVFIIIIRLANDWGQGQSSPSSDACEEVCDDNKNGNQDRVSGEKWVQLVIPKSRWYWNGGADCGYFTWYLTIIITII